MGEFFGGRIQPVWAAPWSQEPCLLCHESFSLHANYYQQSWPQWSLLACKQCKALDKKRNVRWSFQIESPFWKMLLEAPDISKIKYSFFFGSKDPKLSVLHRDGLQDTGLKSKIFMEFVIWCKKCHFTFEAFFPLYPPDDCFDWKWSLTKHMA